MVFPTRLAVVDGECRFTYAELSNRTARLSGGLIENGIVTGERVAVLAPNTHVALEATLGIPGSGAVLLALNTRLAPPELATILDHAGARLLIVDQSLADLADQVLRLTAGPIERLDARPSSDHDPYQEFLDAAEPARRPVGDENSLLSLNYTSGTTGRPKGAMYHHRGAFLQAMAMAYHNRLDAESVYLWTLPMFHCNGWAFPWAVTAAGGTHVCLPRVDPTDIWRHVADEGVTHASAAPTVLTSIVYADAAPVEPSHRWTISTGGAPPSPALLSRAAERGIDVVHLYGLTETFGPAILCDWHPEWDELGPEEQAVLKARQGVGNLVTGDIRVMDGTGAEVPWDGMTLGEVAVMGNNTMLGYLEDADQTAQVFPDSYLRTGDLGVRHPDGYVEIRDRAKDIIVSGGENIASIEVEQALDSHPAVWQSAVVAAPDEHWGEVPVAFVQLQPGGDVSVEELIAHARERIAGFKTPKRIIFGELPRTGTGKIQKFHLRALLHDRPTRPS